MQSVWKSCRRCGLHQFRRQVVTGRGTVPARILFIGEAPGKSEDLIGKPFIGPSGRLLEKAFLRAAELAEIPEPPEYYITNVVGCRPTDSKNGPNRQPTGEEAWACYPRLQQLYHRVKPKVVVFIGRVAERSCKDGFPEGIHIVHPAFLLRDGGEASTQYRVFCRQLSDIFLKAI